jgi:septum formation protein
MLTGMILPYPLILASASRGRADLLRAAGFDFTQEPAGVPEPEPAPDADPAAHARALARLKAEAAVPRHPGCLVLAADTVVACDGRILGKPRDAEDAVAMLAFLGGRPHTIVSALCLGLARPGHEPRFEHGEETARVTLRAWPTDRLRLHVARVKPLFCAGAYALQDGGASLVARIEGDPATVIGLSLDRLDRLLAGFGPGPC